MSICRGSGFGPRLGGHAAVHRNVRGVLRARQKEWREAEEELYQGLSRADGEPWVNPKALRTILINYAHALSKNHRRQEARAIEARLAALPDRPPGSDRGCAGTAFQSKAREEVNRPARFRLTPHPLPLELKYLAFSLAISAGQQYTRNILLLFYVRTN